MAADSQIAAIDQQLLQLLSERMKIWRAQDHGERPSEHCAQDTLTPKPSRLGCSIWPESLEAQAMEAQRLGIPPDMAMQWLRHAASICTRQKSLREPIVFLGPIYSYSYLAAVKHFGLAADLVPVTAIPAAFDEIVRAQAKYAVVPIENSTDGRIVDTLGMFARTPVQICGEIFLPIHHCLLGRCTRAEIKLVHSKPQALSQCRNWLAQHLPDAQLVETSSTTAAAALAAEAPGIAAIASAEAGIHYGLQIIDENIEDNTHNVTRFAIIGNRETQPTGADKMSLMFQLDHRPGALARAMVAFEAADVNLTWIESFPLPDRPNEYLFFIELEGHQAEANVEQAIRNLRQGTRRLELLGSYPRGKA